MDEIIEQIPLSFRSLQGYIARLSAVGTPDDGFYTFDETAELFSVWLRNVAAIREECETIGHCLKDNFELKDTLLDLLVDVQSDLAEAQDAAQVKLDNALLSDAKAAKLAKMRDFPDVMPMSSLGTILQDVYNTTICLMRLSKPLLDSHRHHQTTTQRCDKDDSHHVPHFQRLLPRASATTSKRLSKSICARRLKLLRMNSDRKELNPVLGDDGFLRVVLLELASVSDEAIKHESSTRSTVRIEPSSFQDAKNMESSREEQSKLSMGKTDSLSTSPEYMLENLEPSKISTAQRPEGLIHDTESHLGQKVKEASFVDHESSENRPAAVTIVACTRCRVRKTRCDPGLPKCGPCERTGSVCEYYDNRKGRVLNRNYIIYLQHKVRELEEELERETDHDLDAFKETENQAVDAAALVTPAAVATDHEKTSKTCVMCQRSLPHSNKSELRQHYLEDLRPYVCLHEGCSSGSVRYSTIDEWTAHIRASHGQAWRCLFGCSNLFLARTTFEDHMIAEHQAQFTRKELPTLTELCMKHTLDTIATQCPCCGEVIDGSDHFYGHLAKHLEDIAMLSLMPNSPCEFSTNANTDLQSADKIPSHVDQGSTVQSPGHLHQDVRGRTSEVNTLRHELGIDSDDDDDGPSGGISGEPSSSHSFRRRSWNSLSKITQSPVIDPEYPESRRSEDSLDAASISSSLVSAHESPSWIDPPLLELSEDREDQVQTPTTDTKTFDIDEQVLRDIFSFEWGYQDLTVSHDDSGPICFVKFESVVSAFRAAYKLNHSPMPKPDISRLVIALSGRLLNVRVAAGPRLDWPLLEAVEQYPSPVEIAPIPGSDRLKEQQDREQTDPAQRESKKYAFGSGTLDFLSD